MTSHADVCENWVANVEHGREFSASKLDGSNVSARGDNILSYHWWEMARLVRTRTDEPHFWLINGDRYSSSTSKHQSYVRASIARSNLPSVIIPYTALAAAGIERNAILPIEVRADRFIEHRHSIPADFAMPPLRPQEMGSEARCEKGELRVHDVKFSVTHWSRHWDSERKTFADYDETTHYVNGCEARLMDDHWHWETTTHFLGDSLFSATVTEQRDRPATPDEIDGYERLMEWTEAHQREGYPYTGSLEYESFIQQHGERPAASIVSKTRSGEADDWQYTVRERIQHRRRFLSSFDYNERIPLYFLCELPRGKVATVDEAYELLKPRLVKMAEAGGIEVSRQGDIFAVPTELTTKDVKRLTPRGKGRIVKRPAVLGTNHEPSEVMFATGDRVYARGCLYHAPDGWRAPDHARCKMGDGKTWHLLIRNTVPRTVEPANVRAGAAR